jgi:DNA processing protein
MFANNIFKKTNHDQILVDNLRLIRSENIGNKTFFDLIKIYKSAASALKAIPQLAKNGGRFSKINIYSLEQAEQEIYDAQKIGAKFITYLDPLYPSELLHIDDAPPILTVLGNTELLKLTKIAIVGSRNASANGCKFAYNLAQDLGKANFATVSGLARGIDSFVHKGSVNSGTIAVIAGGIDNIYPLENKDLYLTLAKSGLIIAELPYGTKPCGKNFPQRNRIISGLSRAVAIIEATFGSGSLITARMALNQNREVFAMPGFPLDPRSQGTNNLIKQGASILLDAQDIIEQISEFKLNESNIKEFELQNYNDINDSEIEEARKIIKSLLTSSPISVEELINLCNYNISVVLTVILELELAGKIERHPGNKVCLIY